MVPIYEPVCDGVVLGGRRTPGLTVTFSVEPILLELEGRRYVIPLFSSTLAEMVSGRGISGGSSGHSVDSIGRGSGGSGDGGGIRDSSNGSGSGRGKKGRDGSAGRSGANVGTGRAGGSARVRVRYEVHLTALSLLDGEN